MSTIQEAKIKMAKGYTPPSVRIGLDVEILDIAGASEEYFGYAWRQTNEMHQNTVLSIKMKHKWVEKPFWIVIFTGSRYKATEVKDVIAAWGSYVDKDGHISPDGTVYQQASIIDDLEEGSESVQEIVTAFYDEWFGNEELDIYGRMEDDEAALTWAVERLEGIRFIDINMKIDRENPHEHQLVFLRDKIKEIESCMGVPKEMIG